MMPVSSVLHFSENNHQKRVNIMTDLTFFAESLKSENCEIMINSPMSRHTSFKVGGCAGLLVAPKTEEALFNVIKKANAENINYIVIGNGSNLLVRDSGLDCLVIKTTGMESNITFDNETVKCSAGTSLTGLCNAVLDKSLTGLEFAYGIPGTVGGAVFMNAGAYGGEISDVLKEVTHITPDGKIETVSAEKLDLSYRHSFYSENPGYIISSATFRLGTGNKEDIKAKMDDLMGRRKDKQPLEYPSAGSTFKRPEGYFAGALIEQCNLKGFNIRGAEVSEKHAGFIINKNNADATAILDLIEHVKNTVKKETGVTLEPEVKIIP